MSDSPSASLDALVAMTFQEGSDVGERMSPQLTTSTIDTSQDFATVAAQRTALLRAELGDHKKTSNIAAEASMADTSDETPHPDAPPTLSSPEEETSSSSSGAGGALPTMDFSMPPMPDFLKTPGEGVFGGGSTEAREGAPDALGASGVDFGVPGVDDRASHAGVGDEGGGNTGDEDDAYGGGYDGAPGDGAPEPQESQEAASSASAPSGDHGEPAPQGAPESEETSSPSALPAHLQLPNFPKFDINFDLSPGEAAPSSEEPEDALVPPPPEAPPPPPGPPAIPPGLPAHLVPGALGAGAPPPMPAGPMPPPGAPPIAPAAAATGGLPSLPNLGLPALGEPPAKKEVTLLGSEAAEELAQELQQKRSTLPLIFGGLLVVGAILGVGYWQKATILSLISPDQKKNVALSPREKAEAALAEGIIAANDKKWNEAVSAYRQAIELEPNLSQAHLRLAVVYAMQKKQEAAVGHYRKYVELEPTAPNAKEVQKIISDFEKAQQKTSPEVAQDDDKKRKRKKPRKR